MAKPFDATLNLLIDLRPGDWAAFLAARAGIPPGPATVVDTDLSVTAQADKVFRIDGPEPVLVHLEMESSSSLGIPAQLMRYNVLLAHHLGLPVHSVLMLLRRRANASDQTGVHRVVGPGGLIHEFRYTVVRVWEEQPDGFLGSNVGLAPLALLTDRAADDLQAAFEAFRERLRQPDVTTTVEREVLSSVFFLCGLRYTDEQITDLMRRLSMTLEDSTTYQLVLRQGEARGITIGEARGEARGRAGEAHALLLRQGTKKFGAEPTAEPRLRAITDIDRLERMADRIFDATSWDDLLATA